MTKFVLSDRTPATFQESLLASVPFPMVLLGSNEFIGFANPAAELFFDISASLMKRQTLKSLIAPDSAVHALIEQARRRGVAASEYGVEVLLPKIGSRIVDASVVPVVDVPGSVLLVLQERSIAKKMDQHLNQIHLGNSVSSMAAILAHEIKNPLAGIRGAAQLIEQNASDSDRSLTRLICDETDRIRDLVDRTEIFTDHRRVDCKPVNIHEVLDHVKRLATSSFAQSIQFHEFYDPSLPPVAGDRDRLIQVYLNLVKNAADALQGQSDGEISLQTSFKAGVHLAVGRTKGRMSLPLEITVRDNGPGVPEQVRQSLFEPFVTSKPKGQGLGLAIVAKIISDHGGTIECESEPRRTSFRTRLPVYRQEQERQQ
jgi:two-component system nitrogen regulation sensor histidine kinase GlnL